MFENRTIDWENQPIETGVYVCSQCRNPLFSAGQKFDSKTGFPSFWVPLPDRVREQTLETYNRHRIQVLCQTCGQHLGHLFEDNRTPSLVRYCINADSIRFQP
ncbi:peptide-methionine (R)-S-oxide reductase [Rufibacter sp. LB8]|uniref:peptide-methionine (R)-S-oxide reductase n=1 Tax=Rufibacter sp. LB8 TaxID=2777781 RepID=UPI001CEF9A1B|nr:peptide-methionine (R)-S-oxide reductase [Rufibacter sp. LB8]